MSPELFNLAAALTTVCVAPVISAVRMRPQLRPQGRTIEQIFQPDGTVHLYNAARDLQQNGPVLPTAFKVKHYNDCQRAGLVLGEPVSFVNPKRVPQMADADLVVPLIERTWNTFVVGLIGNMEGYERAVAAKVDGISLMGGTDAFCRLNIGCSEEEALARYGSIVQKARERNIRSLYYHSGSFICPVTKKPTSFNDIKSIAQKIFDMGCDQFIACDTTGEADPKWTYDLFRSLSEVVPLQKVAFHAHGIPPMVFDNVEAAIKAGVRVLHGSLGRAGKGCISVNKEQKIKGNVPLDELIGHLKNLHISIDPRISEEAVIAAKNDFEKNWV